MTGLKTKKKLKKSYGNFKIMVVSQGFRRLDTKKKSKQNGW